jgi:tRNA(fMet)-specific endonuclease VapC
MIVADTDVLIDFLRGRAPIADRVALEIRSGVLATTAISVFELEAGAKTKSERQKVADLLGALRILPLEEDAARLAAEVRQELEAHGTGIGTADYLIAGICLARSAILVTRNRDHFERVASLTLATLPSVG